MNEDSNIFKINKHIHMHTVAISLVANVQNTRQDTK